jgi:hypothetical protein
LFVICLNSIWKRAVLPGDGWQITPQWLLDELSYADDIALLDLNHAGSERRLQMLNDVAKSAAAMQISRPKTMRMVIQQTLRVGKTTDEEIAALNLRVACKVCGRLFPSARSLPGHKQFCGKADASRKGQKVDRMVKEAKRTAKVAQIAKIKLNGEEIDNVDSFKYLGSVITSHGSDRKEVQARIEQSLRVFKSHGSIWKDRRLGIGLKVRLYKARVLSVLLYGSESWRFTATILKNLRGFTSRCYNYMTRKHDAKFSDAINSIDVIWYIDKRRWQWLGHVLRMSNDRNPHRALELLKPSPGSLLAHLNLELRSNLVVAKELASDVMAWNKTFEDGRFVSIKHVIPC